MNLTIVMMLLGLVERLPELVARLRQSGELSEAEDAALTEKYEQVFSQPHWKRRDQ